MIGRSSSCPIGGVYMSVLLGEDRCGSPMMSDESPAGRSRELERER